ncbi:patatin-like phospholipase family protein [Haliscomenobacter hydrossis]|uniref:Patatin n=1 Tax=Haliscomenobacter hydrossis (strain ATCC 27775 / DSM 1100 / LMG 10767 / O) TaxID=760192 RepID=F4L6S5_HALH1|nr:patatin-like phospholipase family protein [Haliscomenobacter hydrossis]AEE50906.1 Patatin [Haliscomenobacter hydrossis DSM 1100]
MQKPIKVLSIDGGGTRGVFPATLLNCIEKETGKKIHELFDVIVGAATGGIIATALAAGMDTKSIGDIYLHQAKYILPRSFFRSVWNIRGLFAAKYSNQNLKKLLEEKFGNKTLADVDGPVFLFPTLKLNPALSTGQIKGFKVEIFNTKNPEHGKELLVDVALRTAAAATNLPIYQGYVEGGNYANDPALAGFFYCLGIPKEQGGEGGLGAALSDIKILSIGCGSDGKSFIPTDKIGRGNWGVFRWLGYLVSLVIEAKMVATQYYLRQIFTSDQYLRINVDYNAPEAPAALRGQKLAIDVRDQPQLDAIHEYAYLTFEKHKTTILNFIQ